MSLEVYGDEGDVGCEGCADLESQLEELKERLKPTQSLHELVIMLKRNVGSHQQQLCEARKELAVLQAFCDMAAKVECQGKCGKFQPVLQDSEFGQRTRNGEWLCPPCHSKVCGLDVSVEENRFHNCQALR